MNLKEKSSQKGISILFIVLIMGVILSIGLGLGGIFVQQSKIMRDIGKSIIAFYAADSGIEAQLFDIYTKASSSLLNFSTTTAEGTSINVYVQCGKEVDEEQCPEAFSVSETCDAFNFCLKSVGNYGKAQRAIEIIY